MTKKIIAIIEPEADKLGIEALDSHGSWLPIMEIDLSSLISKKDFYRIPPMLRISKKECWGFTAVQTETKDS